jgi:PPOX class probable F420-dependent enzyme
MDDREMRALVATARVGRLATVRTDGTPHVVPVCFVAVHDGDELVTAVDAKPKSTTALARLDNVRAHPQVALLVDHYDDDWSRLWWVRVDGVARVVDVSDHHAAVLATKYEQYRETRPPGPAIVVSATRYTGWAGSGRRL